MIETEKREEYIKTLENFKFLLNSYFNISYGGLDRQVMRSTINREKQMVEKLVQRAGALKVIQIAPPALVGGFVFRNLNPFDIIFDPPYGVSVLDTIIDSIDEAIGSIKLADNFTLTPKIIKEIPEPNLAIDKKSVFLVHGHDNEIKEQVARFLDKIGLNPIILHEQTNSGLTIIEKFEKFSNTNYAIVLMTPDDVGSSIMEAEKLTPRARQNVIFELGYFFGKLGRSKVCALLKGNIERHSDYDGILYLGYDNQGAWKLLLVKESKQAGLDFDSNKIF